MLRQALETLEDMEIVVVSAHNSAVTASQVPADYPTVLSVDAGDAAAGLSVSGGYQIHAPSERFSTNLDQSIGLLSTALGGGIGAMRGAAVAVAHVSAVTALLCESANGMISSKQLRQLIVDGAVPIMEPRLPSEQSHADLHMSQPHPDQFDDPVPAFMGADPEPTETIR